MNVTVMRKANTFASLILLTLFVLPIASKVGDSLFHFHHHEIARDGSPINLSDYHAKCLVFQYELTGFEPQVIVPQIQAYFNVNSKISERITVSFYADSFDIKNPRAPPFAKFKKCK